MQWLTSFDTVIFDADGVLWRSDTPIEGAPQTFNALRATGKRAYICTNNSGLASAAICTKAQNMGILVAENEILSSGMALARYLQEHEFKRKVYLVGEPGLAHELQAVGIESVVTEEEDKCMLGGTIMKHAQRMTLDPDVGAVVVGIDRHFNTLKLTKAGSYLSNASVLFLATNRDRAFPICPGRYVPGAGIMVGAIQAATNRTPFTCGKPNSYMCLHLIRQGVIKPERTLMVGDTLYTDIQFGYNCGFQTLLVGTGVSSFDDVLSVQTSKEPLMYQQVPDLYLNKLSDLLKFLPSRNCYMPPPISM